MKNNWFLIVFKVLGYPGAANLIKFQIKLENYLGGWLFSKKFGEICESNEKGMQKGGPGAPKGRSALVTNPACQVPLGAQGVLRAPLWGARGLKAALGKLDLTR